MSRGLSSNTDARPLTRLGSATVAGTKFVSVERSVERSLLHVADGVEEQLIFPVCPRQLSRSSASSRQQTLLVRQAPQGRLPQE